MKHEDVYELIESYAFGTAEPDEFAQIDAHLATGCAECLARLREVGEVSVRLAAAVPQHNPPAHVKDALMSRIGADRDTATPTAAVEAARVTPLEPRRRSWLPLGGSLVAAAAVIALMVNVFSLRNEIRALRGDLTAARDEIATLTGDMDIYQHTALLLGSPCTRAVDLDGVDPNPNAYGKVFFNPEERSGVVYFFRMPQAPAGMEYQIWAMRDGKPTSIGMFTVAADGSAMIRMDDMKDPVDVAAFQVTIEPKGGLNTPTGMLYLTGVDDGAHME